ncbi:RNA-binding motif protein, X-linked 2-like isoform X2 [Oncorhynchus keta]|uniref:RNA-binding motif protein, X-linked 2-like isoform X2 n=1 Tax=Oncorhynchus keta TaxID=8018 RepID=UPI00227ACDCA|nr:RNA-binding motif protein, X-linked 2-like isoform X2 [Oncorhynchus keta]XP_052313000.1 RNA-binding motif protein, X-linked 2-like isoform X2 [Oncorhynchus keta]XP_052313001.1 RNA-binding motif protein, X-linked 2-like isoform X2 [Oncorhynchus keta]
MSVCRYGEMANINLVRDKKTGKSKGFCFICYEDQRSTILAVDNLNGIKIKGRTIRVDHVLNYRPPKDNEDMDDITKRLREEGCAPKLPDPSSSESEEEVQYAVPAKKPKKDKKEKKKKEKALKEDRKQRERLAQTHSLSPPRPALAVRVKQEEDLGYDKYSQRGAPEEWLGAREERPGPGAEPQTHTGRWTEGSEIAMGRGKERERSPGRMRRGEMEDCSWRARGQAGRREKTKTGIERETELGREKERGTMRGTERGTGTGRKTGRERQKETGQVSTKNTVGRETKGESNISALIVVKTTGLSEILFFPSL